MEADWEVEIGPDAPVIDATWAGFVDLSNHPERIGGIEEAREFPALARALLRLNAKESNSDMSCLPGVWTSKCDVWSFDQCDPYELDATPEEAATGLACYIDLLPRDGAAFAELRRIEIWARGLVGLLRQVACNGCRADLVIRRALLRDQEGFGITAYISSCGVDRNAAKERLGMALSALASTIDMDTAPALKP